MLLVLLPIVYATVWLLINYCTNTIYHSPVYKQSQAMCKQYEHALGNSVGNVKPERHPFFMKLGPAISLRLDTSTRENGFM